MPKSTPTSTAAAAQNATTRASKVTVTDAGRTPAGITAGAAARIAAPTAAPSTPPTAASTRLSVSNWRTTRPRPAPSAERIASSRDRAVARASSRLATLAQQMSSTKPTTPRNSIEVTRRSLPMIAWRTGTTSTPRPRFSGTVRASSAATAVISARARSTDAPAASRPIPRMK